MGFGPKKAKAMPLQLPVLAVCPPSRPHTPRSIDITVARGVQPGSATRSHDDKTTLATDRIDPASQTPTTPPRLRSFSVANGLLSPQPSPGSPNPSNWSLSSGESDYSFSRTHSLCESPTGTNFAASSQFSTSDAEDPGISAGEDSQFGGPRRTVYHIYHSGYLEESFSIHLASDSRSKPGPKKSILRKWTESDVDPRVPIYYLHRPRLYNHCPGRTLRWGGDGRDFIRERTVKDGSKKKYRRDMKYAPAICHISGDMLWRKWEIEFAVLVPRDDDPKVNRPEGQEKLFWRHRHSWSNLKGLFHAKSAEEAKIFQGKHTKDKSSWIYKGLNEPGVIDGRGLINSWYPFRKGPYRWRAGGETGKEWVLKEAAKRKVRRKSTSDAGVLKNARSVDCGGMDREEVAKEDEEPVLLPPEVLPKHLLPIQLDPVPGAAVGDENSTGSALMPAISDVPQTTPNEKGPPHPAKLELDWPKVFFRDYPFTYISVPFYWRGTSDLHEYKPDGEGDAITKRAVEEAKRKKGIDWCMLAHLKLVVVLPRSVVDGWGEVGARVLGQDICNTSGTSMDNLGKEGDTEDLEGGLKWVKRRSRSLSIFSNWSESTKMRNTSPKEEREHEQELQQLYQSVPLESRENVTKKSLLGSRPQNESEGNSIRNGDSSDNTSQQTTNLTSNQGPPSLQPSRTRSSTWGTCSSTSTLVWPSCRSNTTFSQVSTSTLTPMIKAKGKVPRMEKGKVKAPGGAYDEGSHETKVEVVLARYQCVLGQRKAGRLVVDEDVLERVAQYVYGDGRKVKVLNNPERARNSRVVKGKEKEESEGDVKDSREELGLGIYEGPPSTGNVAKAQQILRRDEILVEGTTKTIGSIPSFSASPTLLPSSSPNLGEEVSQTDSTSSFLDSPSESPFSSPNFGEEGSQLNCTPSLLTPPTKSPFSLPDFRGGFSQVNSPSSFLTPPTKPPFSSPDIGEEFSQINSTPSFLASPTLLPFSSPNFGEGSSRINSTPSFLTSPTLSPLSSPNLGEEPSLSVYDGLSPITAAKGERVLDTEELLVEDTTKFIGNNNTSSLASPEPSTLGLAQLHSTPAERSSSQQDTYTQTTEKGEQTKDQHYQCENQPQGSLEDPTTQRERLCHVVVATVMCLIIAEEEKREWVREIILGAATEGASAA